MDCINIFENSRVTPDILGKYSPNDYFGIIKQVDRFLTYYRCYARQLIQAINKDLKKHITILVYQVYRGLFG